MSTAVCCAVTAPAGFAQVLEVLAGPDWLCSPQAPGCLRRAPGAAEGAGDAEAAGGERVRMSPAGQGAASPGGSLVCQWRCLSALNPLM